MAPNLKGFDYCFTVLDPLIPFVSFEVTPMAAPFDFDVVVRG